MIMAPWLVLGGLSLIADARVVSATAAARRDGPGVAGAAGLRPQPPAGLVIPDVVVAAALRGGVGGASRHKRSGAEPILGRIPEAEPYEGHADDGDTIWPAEPVPTENVPLSPAPAAAPAAATTTIIPMVVGNVTTAPPLSVTVTTTVTTPLPPSVGKARMLAAAAAVAAHQATKAAETAAVKEGPLREAEAAQKAALENAGISAAKALETSEKVSVQVRQLANAVERAAAARADVLARAGVLPPSVNDTAAPVYVSAP